MALQRGHDEYLNPFSPHTKGHKLQQEGFAGSRCAENRNIGILINQGIENIHNGKGVVKFVDSQQNAVIIAHLKADKGITACNARCKRIPLGAGIQVLFQRYQRQR